MEHLAQRAIERLAAEQGPIEELYQFPSDVTSKQLVTTELEAAFQTIPQDEGADMLIAINDYHRGLTVLHTSNSVVSVAKSCEVIGTGENSLVRFLIRNSYNEAMSYESTVALSVLVVYAAKVYCPQYCGGLTDICALRTADRDVFDVPRSRIDALELFFETAFPLQINSLLSEAATLVHPIP